MTTRPLRLWNGRWQGGTHGGGHAFVAAYSRADAVRVITEVLGYEPRGMAREISVYWAANCWGNTMAGITPERGLWVAKGQNGKPVRMMPKTVTRIT